MTGLPPADANAFSISGRAESAFSIPARAAITPCKTITFK